MLVLTRRAGETINISKDIQVVVTQVGRGKVVLGITAPKSMPITRTPK